MNHDRTDRKSSPRWYAGISRYQWLVLTVASLGWIFDIFEGQVFVASMREAMPALVPPTTGAGDIDFLNKIAMASFLLGGALGGVFFGAVADRIGRARTLAITILVYSFFTLVTALAQAPWQMIVLRFVVALGTGGEWAVGAAFVAEVFPRRSRAWTSSIFHASSVFGTLLAVLAGAYVIGNPDLGESSWRWGFALGALPAVLVLWIRWKVREPERWVAARQTAKLEARRSGSVRDLFSGQLIKVTLIGVALATTGLATFWSVHIFGKSVTLENARMKVVAGAGLSPERDAAAVQQLLETDTSKSRLKKAEMFGMFLTTLGGGAGLVLFGFVATRLGRRGAFLIYYLGGFVVTLVVFRLIYGSGNQLAAVVALPVFGFFTLGMHAGYAVYFPELYPTRLRSVGSGFCFNVGRLTAAPILIVTAFLQRPITEGGWGWSNEDLASWMGFLFLAGAALTFLAPETRGKELPE